MNLHCYRFAPIVFLWFASVRLINRSWLDYHSHYTSSLIMIEGFIFNVYIYIIQLWVTFNNLLLLLVHITAAICSLIFLYAWVSVSVHGGGEMMPLTHGVTRPPWHLSHCSPSLSWSQNNTSSHLHVPVPVSTDHRFTQDLFEAFFLLDFFWIWDLSLFMGGGCQMSQVTRGANCPIRSFPPITWLLSDWHSHWRSSWVWVPFSLSCYP